MFTLPTLNSSDWANRSDCAADVLRYCAEDLEADGRVDAFFDEGVLYVNDDKFYAVEDMWVYGFRTDGPGFDDFGGGAVHEFSTVHGMAAALAHIVRRVLS